MLLEKRQLLLAEKTTKKISGKLALFTNNTENTAFYALFSLLLPILTVEGIEEALLGAVPKGASLFV